jgi:hypothetical protein
MDMGVWKVSLSNGTAMIPINSTMANVYGGTNSDYLEGQTGYTITGSSIRFTKTVSSTVIVSLLVSDFSVLDINEVLPISPEMEADIVADVLDRISQGKISQPELNVKQNAN